MRKRTGIGNRYRSRGTGTYCRQLKRIDRDRYGRWESGRQIEPDTINGKKITHRMSNR